MDEAKAKKLKKLITLEQEPALAIFDELEDINENLPEIRQALSGIELIKGEKGDKGDKGDNGKDGYNGRDGKNGKDGIDGKNGKDGKNGIDGKDGYDGLDGKDGKDGEKGDKPDHEWTGTKLKFEKPNGKWGKAVDLKGEIGRQVAFWGSASNTRVKNAGALVSDEPTKWLNFTGTAVNKISNDGNGQVTVDLSLEPENTWDRTGTTLTPHIPTDDIMVSKLIGGSTTTSDLTLQTTSGVGTTGADMHFLVGNNGATEAMTILNNGNVGIGTTNPTGKLSVQGSSVQFRSETSGESRFYFYSGDDGNNADLRMYDNAQVEKVHIESSGDSYFNAGNVGIGTTGPVSKLALGGAGSSNGMSFDVSSDGTRFAQIYYDAGAVTTAQRGLYIEEYNVGVGTSRGIHFKSGNAERLTILGNGNVGVGTTSPGEKLEVNGNVLINSNLYLGKTSGTYPSIYTNSNIFTITGQINQNMIINGRGNSGGEGIDLQYNGNSGLFLQSTTGNVGIGTTNPTALLHLGAGTATNPQLKLTDSTLLTTPEVGSIEYSGGKLYVTNVATRKAISRASGVLIETVTVSDTTTETTLVTEPIAANALRVGNVQRFSAYGLLSTVLPTDEVTIRIKAGGDTVATIVNPGKTLSDECWSIEAITTIRSLGTTGSVATRIVMEVEDETVKVCQVVELDTTSALDITVTAEWNNAKAGNTLVLNQALMEYLN